MIYLSGRITGLERSEYLSIFKAHEQKLTWGKATVINPAEVTDKLPQLEYDQYMMVDEALMKLCDTIYLIPGWEESKGAKIELEYALRNGYRVMVGERL